MNRRSPVTFLTLVLIDNARQAFHCLTLTSKVTELTPTSDKTIAAWRIEQELQPVSADSSVMRPFKRIRGASGLPNVHVRAS